jgi:hypothetical protein
MVNEALQVYTFAAFEQNSYVCSQTDFQCPSLQGLVVIPAPERDRNIISIPAT